MHSQLTVVMAVGCFAAGLLAHRTPWSHPHREMEAWAGVATFGRLYSRSSFVNSEKGKMLDPSGCLYFTLPRIASSILVRSEQNLAHPVATAVANKACFKSTLKLRPTKSYACLLAIDCRLYCLFCGSYYTFRARRRTLFQHLATTNQRNRLY